MFCIKNERGVHGAHPAGGRRAPMQQVQEMSAHRVIVGFEVNPLAIVREVIPVAEHRSETGDQVIGDCARARRIVIFPLRQHTTHGRSAGAHHIHGMRGGRQLLEHRTHRRRQAAQLLEPGLVSSKLRFVRQLAVNQQVGDLFEFAGFRDFENVVTAIVQVVATTADAA